MRPAWVAAGLCLSALAAFWTGGNRFTPAGGFAWAASIASLLHGLSGGEAGRAPGFRRPSRGAAAALLALTLLAGFLRLGAFSSVPPEPTSDHVEKALDAVRVGEGARPVFCPANGGREPLQLYLLALLALLPCVRPYLHGLTLLTSLEGALTIPLFFFAGLGLAAAGALRRGDRASLLVPAALVLLLLPSAVAAAFPIENPSATRASLLDGWRQAWARNAHAHREIAAEVTTFLEDGGRPGNVFVVGFRHGPDDRAIAMEAGLAARSPGLPPEERPLVRALGPAFRGADPRRPDFDPGGALLLLLSPRDEAGLAELRAAFPSANVRRFVTGGPDHGFVRVDVPAGEAARLLEP